MRFMTIIVLLWSGLAMAADIEVPTKQHDPRYYFVYRAEVPHCVLMDRVTKKTQLAVDPKTDGTCDYDVLDDSAIK